MLDSPAPGFDGGKRFIQKIAVVTRWIIINLEICLKRMNARADQTRCLMVQFNRKISRICYFLDTQLKEIPISDIYDRISSNSP